LEEKVSSIVSESLVGTPSKEKKVITKHGILSLSGGVGSSKGQTVSADKGVQRRT